MTEYKISNDEQKKNKSRQENSKLDFNDVFEEFQRPVYGYILRLTRDPAQADDLTQETFIRVNRGLSSFRNDSNLSTWIYRIATNLSTDYFRKIGTTKAGRAVSLEERESEGESIVDGDSVSIESSAERTEMSSCVQDFIYRLPIDYQTVLILSDEQGMKNREIADVLGCSLQTVKIRLHRARNEIRNMLSDGCSFSRDERNVFVCEVKQEEQDNRLL